MTKTLISFVALTILAGCASAGFNRGALRDQIGVSEPVVTDSEIKAALASRPNLPKPFKMAVYFKDPEAGKRTSASGEWRWTEKDRALFLSISEDFKSEGLISAVFPVINTTGTDDLKGIRMAAARQGADAVLLISGAPSTDRYTNALAWSYLLVIPTLFMPGSEVDTLFLTQASLWDVRNEYLYLASEAENVLHRRYVPAFGDRDKELIEISKAQALEKLKKNLITLVRDSDAPKKSLQ